MKNLKTTTIIILLCSFTLGVNGQTADTTSWYDFWVGEWDLTWDDGKGNTGKGTNRVLKVLDNKVIQENFEAKEGQYKGTKGMSLSVFNPTNKSWHQAWADNQGGYFDLTGEIDGQKKYSKQK